LAVTVHVPADKVVTVLPLIEQMAEELAAMVNTTGLLEPSPVAETVNVPWGLNTGAAGFATKLVMFPVALGVTLLDAADGEPVATLLVAVTVNV
jgi:hypothetical protein